MKLRPVILLLSAIALFACAPPSPAPPAAVARPTLRQQLAALPGAVFEGEGELRLRYPGESLFASGAALPLPGGTAMLDPLASLLVAHPGVRGAATVRALTGVSADYDRDLAQKRAELLARYFRNRGIPAERLSLTAEAGDGAPLELILAAGDQPASAVSSSGEK